jgi:F0F1-type ATP synthase assembly protein I
MADGRARRDQRHRAGLRSSCITTIVPDRHTNSEKKPQSDSSSLIGAWVQAEKMMQIALMLPCAAFIGWAAGALLDRLLHQTWIAMAGVVFGIISGLIGAIRMAMVYTSRSDRASEDGSNKGNSDTDS